MAIISSERGREQGHCPHGFCQHQCSIHQRLSGQDDEARGMPDSSGSETRAARLKSRTSLASSRESPDFGRKRGIFVLDSGARWRRIVLEALAASTMNAAGTEDEGEAHGRAIQQAFAVGFTRDFGAGKR